MDRVPASVGRPERSVARAERVVLRPGLDLTKWGIYPAVGATLVLFVVPLTAMLVVSFWQRSAGGLEATWDLSNYVTFLGRPYLLDALINSIEVTLTTTVFSVIVAYPLAYVLAYKVPPRWQRLALVLTVLPFWTPYVVRHFSLLLILAQEGVFNWALLRLGVVGEPLNLGFNRFAVVLGFVHFFIMLLTLTIYANLVQIKQSYRLAAADLGASGLQVFLRITLPLSLPGVAVGAFITFVIAMGDYITPKILGGAQEMLLPQAIVLQIERAADIPMASTMSISLMVVVTITYFLFAKHLRMERL
jgi:spermidine/putrescine transport system permease protein